MMNIEQGMSNIEVRNTGFLPKECRDAGFGDFVINIWGGRFG